MDPDVRVLTRPLWYGMVTGAAGAFLHTLYTTGLHDAGPSIGILFALISLPFVLKKHKCSR